MRFRKITALGELKTWLNLTDSLYVNGKFVSPIRQQLRSIFRTQGNRHGTSASFYIVEDDTGVLLARTTAHTNEAFDERLSERVQLFGFTEFVNRYDVFETLMRGLEGVARESGRALLFGPSNLLPNEAGGVITSGFEYPGLVDSSYNPAYYPEFYSKFGFERRFSSATYICDSIQRGSDPDQLLRFDDARFEQEKLKICYGDRRQFQEQIELLRNMLNASFSVRPYYTQISAEDMRDRMAGFNYLLDERLLIYLTREGRPIAFIVCIPDISLFLTKVRGDLNLLNQVALLLTRKRYKREALILIAGAIPDFQGAGYFRLLMRELLRNLQSGGYEAVRSTSVELNNPTVSNTLLKMGARVLHHTSYYQRRL